MFCPFCSYEDTKVLESWIVEDSVRRRRECLKCANRFTTYEKAIISLKVQKKDGREEEFDVQKIARSISKALNKPEEELVLSLSKSIEKKIVSKRLNPVKSVFIGRLVMQELKRVDKMAYLRYATIYKKIDDPKGLEKELQAIAER